MTDLKFKVQNGKCKVSEKHLRLTFKFVLCTLHFLCLALPAAAQTGGVTFLSRFDYVLGLEYLAAHDPRFDWDAIFGGELDLVDFTRGRLVFEAEYQAVLGNEYQPFDPNQGHYTLAGVLSARVRGVEIAAVYHHVSRHLGDRPKKDPIDWNMLGGRVRTALTRGDSTVDVRADLRRVVLRTFVDYRWELDTEMRARVRRTDRTAFIAAGAVRVLGVDDLRGRGTQYGARGEGGVRLDGRAAALELFVAAERRIDPYQLEFATGSWMTAGFRILSR